MENFVDKKYSNFCKRCGKKLKDEESMIRGYGPKCWERVKEDRNQINLFKEVQSGRKLYGNNIKTSEST